MSQVVQEIKGPAKSPCEVCPYRRDVPSGVWTAEEYAKLPGYDLPTAQQPTGVFLCHGKNGRVCAGWAGCHGPQVGAFDLLALRFGMLFGIARDVMRAICEYVSPVPLFGSGAEAAEHGLRDVDAPGAEAVAAMERLGRKRALRDRRRA